MDGHAWYALQMKRFEEMAGRERLATVGIESYLPMLVEWPRPSVGSAVQPMFPGYLLVRAVLPREFTRIAWTPGVKRFVAFGEGPVPVEDAIVRFLHDRESADGLIYLSAPEGRPDCIRITEGPFRGLMALLERRLPARERVVVLLRLMQRETPVELPERCVKRA